MNARTLTPKPSVPKLASRSLLQRFGIHPKDRDAVRLDMSGTRALCIATNHGVLDIGVPTGVFGSELTVPYYVFLDAGMRVDVASPRGGVIPVDPLSMKELIRTPDDDRLLAREDVAPDVEGVLHGIQALLPERGPHVATHGGGRRRVVEAGSAAFVEVFDGERGRCLRANTAEHPRE